MAAKKSRTNRPRPLSEPARKFDEILGDLLKEVSVLRCAHSAIEAAPGTAESDELSAVSHVLCNVRERLGRLHADFDAWRTRGGYPGRRS